MRVVATSALTAFLVTIAVNAWLEWSDAEVVMLPYETYYMTDSIPGPPWPPIDYGCEEGSCVVLLGAE